MFKELLPLLRQRTVMMTISAVSDAELRVNIIPKQKGESENTALTTPLSVTGSAEELDQELPQAIVEFVAKHLTLKQSLEATKAEIDAAEKQAKEDAKNKVKTITIKGKPTTPAKPTEPAKTEPPKPPAPPSLFDAPAQEPASTDAPASAPTLATTAAAPAQQADAAVSGEEEEDDEAVDGADVAQADAAYATRASAREEQQLMIA